MRYPRFEARLPPRTNLHGNRPCAGAIYGSRQIAKRTGAQAGRGYRCFVRSSRILSRARACDDGDGARRG